MKQGSTLFLKGVLVFMAIAAIALCVGIFYDAMSRPADVRNAPFLLILTAVIPFIFALYQAFTLLNNIDKNMAFSSLSIKALKLIKYSAVVISVIFAAEMPVVFQIAEEDDAPGIIIVWLVVIAAPVVVAVFAAVLQKLLQNGIDIKSENDLTV